MSPLRQHLSEEEVAQCADAINDNHYLELPPDLKLHLSQCDDCAAEVLMVVDITFDFKTQIVQAPVRSFRPWLIAASAMVAVIALVFVALHTFLPQDSDTNQTDPLARTNTVDAPPQLLEPVEQTHDGSAEDVLGVRPNTPNQSDEDSYTPTDTDSNLLAFYTPDPTLETLASNFAQAYRSSGITVQSDNLVRVPGTDSLRWTNPSLCIVSLEIFNNKGEKILETQEESKGFPIPKLSGGLYYWKLITSEFDLVFVGKIVVE